jgi:hypothetical protein
MQTRKNAIKEYYKDFQESLRSQKSLNEWCLTAIKKISYNEDEIEANLFLHHNLEAFSTYEVDSHLKDGFVAHQEKIIQTLLSGVNANRETFLVILFDGDGINTDKESFEYALILRTHTLCTLMQMRKFLNEETKQQVITYAMEFASKSLGFPHPSNELVAMVLQSLVDMFSVMTKLFDLKYVGMLFYMMAFLEDDFKEKAFDTWKKCAEKINFSDLKSLMTKLFNEFSDLVVLTKRTIYFDKVNSLLNSLQLKEAINCYMPVAQGVKNVERAYELFQDIPDTAIEYSEAQYFFSKLACFDSEFTPDDFKTEDTQNKEKRLLAMKEYLDKAAQGGYSLAILEKSQVDKELARLRTKRKADTFFQPAVVNDSVSSDRVVSDEEEKEEKQGEKKQKFTRC